eukprot:4474032-Pleurochrysis_carterae.AAC.1
MCLQLSPNPPLCGALSQAHLPPSDPPPFAQNRRATGANEPWNNKGTESHPHIRPQQHTGT